MTEAMPVSLTPEILSLLDDPSTIKVLATVDAEGVPHAVVKQSLHAGPNGRLHYLEVIESSRTARNLVRSLWFDQTVAVVLAAADGRSVQIKGRPVKNHVSGPLFLHHYQRVRDLYGDVDLAGVWEIEPLQVLRQGLPERIAEESARHPTFVHLDRLLAPSAP